MKNIFIGLFFLFLHFNLGSVNILPAWVGYCLFFSAFAKGPDCPSRSTSLTICAGAALVDLLLWVGVIFGYSVPVLGAVLQLLTTYRVLLWCEELGLDDGYLIHRLRMSWYALAGATAAGTALSLVYLPMGLLWSLVALVAAIVYIYTYYRIWKQTPDLAEAGEEEKEGEDGTW